MGTPYLLFDKDTGGRWSWNFGGKTGTMMNVPARIPCQLVNPGDVFKELTQCQEQLMSALDDLEAALAASAKRSDADAAAAKSCFLNGSKPNMMDLMLLPMLERVEALLLHPFLQVSGLELRNWPRVWAMLAEGRRPGVCSFGHLCSDAETLLAISLREDPGEVRSKCQVGHGPLGGGTRWGSSLN